MNQLKMFKTEDLPLFSGTAPTGHVETFDPKPEHRQGSFAKCHLCKDTGRVKGGLCWCKAGNRIRDEIFGVPLTHYITNDHDQPINVLHDGSGPRIQVSKKCAETYRSLEEAQERLAYLRQRTGRPLANLKVSTFAKF